MISENRALYFGCGRGKGHYLYSESGETIWKAKSVPGFPWSEALMDCGLLKNGKNADIYDGKVFWTCGGNPLWLAFVWWDNSVDSRPGSNSGFYVKGFTVADRQLALDYAGFVFPAIIKRQRQPLVLQP